MKLRHNLAGRKFGMLTAIEHLGYGQWHCLCDCGRERDARSSKLRSGKIKDCGCLRRRDIAGKKFGNWTAGSHVYGGNWRCRCDCGKTALVPSGRLLSGKSKSCGCLPHTNKKHGKPPEYNSWRAMKARCQNPNNNRYAKYGAAGIKVCRRWQSFLDWYADMGPKPTRSHSIDRRADDDSTAHYSCGRCDECIENGWKSHCTWATPVQQAQNRRPRT